MTDGGCDRRTPPGCRYCGRLLGMRAQGKVQGWRGISLSKGAPMRLRPVPAGPGERARSANGALAARPRGGGESWPFAPACPLCPVDACGTLPIRRMGDWPCNRTLFPLAVSSPAQESVIDGLRAFSRNPGHRASGTLCALTAAAAQAGVVWDLLRRERPPPHWERPRLPDSGRTRPDDLRRACRKQWVEGPIMFSVHLAMTT
jgi:hypothetical protein